jgi:hypothetical protein
MICRKCHYRVLRRSYCGECYAILREIRAPLKRVELLDSRRRRAGALTYPLRLALAVLVPGSGHALHGAHRRAFLYLAGTALLILIAGAGGLWPDPGAPIEGAGGAGRWIAFGAAWIALGALSLNGTIRLARFGDNQADSKTPRSA